MTLDLNFEEKGQQNDIPIRFKVENPWVPGDKLLVNGQQGPVTVVPSSNKDDIKLVTITAACEYFMLGVDFNPFTPTSDQHINSLYNSNTLTAKQTGNEN